MEYVFKTEPYQHQLDTWHASRDQRNWALFLEMGTGKSKILADSFGYWLSKGWVDTLILVCPKSLMATWANDVFPVHFPDSLLNDTKVIRWDPKLTKVSMAKTFGSAQYRVLIINAEGLRPVHPGKTGMIQESNALRYARVLAKCTQCAVAIDESTLIKNPQAWRTKALTKHIGPQAKFRRILSGLPNPNSPLDLYSQFHFLDPQILGQKSFFTFKARYAETVERHIAGGKTFKEVVRYRHLEELKDLMRGSATIISKEECLDLPPKVFKNVYVDLSPRQKKVYDEVKAKAFLELADGSQLTVTRVVTQLLRLQQITNNILRTDDGQVRVIDHAKDNPRLQTLWDVIDNVIPEGVKVILWAKFTDTVLELERELNARYGNGTAAAYYGDVSTADRAIIVARFQDPEDRLRFFVGQPKAGGRGLTLTEGKAVIFYADDFDLELRYQAEDRAHRIGQTSSVLYFDFIAKDTIDEKIAEARTKKISLVNQILKQEETF